MSKRPPPDNSPGLRRALIAAARELRAGRLKALAYVADDYVAAAPFEVGDGQPHSCGREAAGTDYLAQQLVGWTLFGPITEG